MSTRAQIESTTGPTVPAEIERLFQGSLLLLVITGFATLASTGKLDWISTVFMSLALLARTYLFLSRREFQIQERWTSYLGIVYIGIYFADFFLLSRDFVTASVHLVLFGMAVKIFSVRRERDHVYLAVLAFLQILSAAVLTVDTIFFVSLSVFTGVAVVTFITMEVRRSAKATKSRAVVVCNSPQNRLDLAVAKTALAILLGITLFGTAIFFVLPRLSYGYLGRLAQQDVLVSGFSDDVTLGQIGRIQQSSQLVMHVKFEGDKRDADELKLRGSALVVFDGKRWSNPLHNIEIVRPSPTGEISLERSFDRADGSELRKASASRRHLARYKVLMEPVGTNTLFLLTRPLGVTGRFRELVVDADNSVQTLDNGKTASEYGGYSDIAEPHPDELRSTTGSLTSDLRRYLQVPAHLDPRISQLAHQVADREPTTYDKAAAIEHYLSSNYGYTLELGSETTADPISNFLFTRKRGHCEYFASSMAIMLRQLGIPTRLITGFRGGEYNNISGSYIIRARDAHSWVEAYLPGKGWATFDPTPGSVPVTVSAWQRAGLYLDAMREFWREWVVNYDVGHQATLASSTLMKSRHTVASLRQTATGIYERLMRWARRTNAKFEKNPRVEGLRLLILGSLLLLLFNLRNLIQLGRLLRITRRPSLAPSSAASVCYERMLKVLRRGGYAHNSSQTAGEFVASISEPELRSAVQRFTESYQRARFADSKADAEQLRSLLEEIKTAGKSVRQTQRKAIIPFFIT